MYNVATQLDDKYLFIGYKLRARHLRSGELALDII